MTIPIIAIATIGVLLIFFRKYTNDERMSLIEKGTDAKIFSYESQRSFGPLRFSLLMIGLGIGLLIGSVLESAGIVDEPPVGFDEYLRRFGSLPTRKGNFNDRAGFYFST